MSSSISLRHHSLDLLLHFSERHASHLSRYRRSWWISAGWPLGADDPRLPREELRGRCGVPGMLRSFISLSLILFNSCCSSKIIHECRVNRTIYEGAGTQICDCCGPKMPILQWLLIYFLFFLIVMQFAEFLCILWRKLLELTKIQARDLLNSNQLGRICNYLYDFMRHTNRIWL